MIRSSMMLILAVVLTAAIYSTGVGISLDSRFGDLLMQQRGIRMTTAPVVYLRLDQATLNEVGSIPWDTQTASTVFDTLKSLSASRVILAASDVLILRDAPVLRQKRWLLIPYSRSMNDSPRPMQLTLPDPDGITRQLYTWNPATGVSGYSWQYEILGRQPEQPSIRVNFVGPPNSIGNLSLSDVLKGAAPSTFVKDKIVVIGVDLPDLTRYVNVPVSDFFSPMAEGEFQAHALITLLEDSAIHRLPSWLNVLVLLVIMLILWTTLLPTTIRGNLILTGLFLTGSIACSAFFFFFANILLPVTGLVAIVLLTFLASAERKARLIQDRTQQIANTSSWELTLRPLTNDRTEITPDRIWEKLTRFAEFHVHPESMFLAQPDNTDGRVTITHVFGAREADIREKRRDLSRTPYSTAIDQSSATVIENFMSDKNLQTVLVPLFYPARLTAFWIVNISTSINPDDIRKSLELIGRQVARQLHFCKALPGRRQRMADSGMDIIQKQLESIDRVFSNLVEEKIIYHSVLDSIGSSIALSDIFGRTLHLNEPLRNILKEKNIRVEQVGSIAGLLQQFGVDTLKTNGGWLLSLSSGKRDICIDTPTYKVNLRVVSRYSETEEGIPEGFLVQFVPITQNHSPVTDEVVNDDIVDAPDPN
jgi:CHASE2 domain-containing sensor protein